MKPPRWVVASLLCASVLAMMGAVAFWWVTWPYRTAREFISLIKHRDADAINAMLVPGNEWPGIGWRENSVSSKFGGLMFMNEWDETINQGHVQDVIELGPNIVENPIIQDRTVGDLITGKMTFDLRRGYVNKPPSNQPLWNLTVQVKNNKVSFLLVR